MSFTAQGPGEGNVPERPCKKTAQQRRSWTSSVSNSLREAGSPNKGLCESRTGKTGRRKGTIGKSGPPKRVGRGGGDQSGNRGNKKNMSNMRAVRELGSSHDAQGRERRSTTILESKGEYKYTPKAKREELFDEGAQNPSPRE